MSTDLEPHQPANASMPAFPRALKIIATTFQIVGILGVVDIILAAVNGRFLIDLNVLGLLIGRGLWRLNAKARWWALFCLWLTLPITTIAIVAIGLFASCTIEEIGALLLIALLCCFGFWQLSVLMRSDIRQLFIDPELKTRLTAVGTGRRYQFSLASLFVAMLIVGIVATRIGTLPFKRQRLDTKASVHTPSSNRHRFRFRNDGRDPKGSDELAADFDDVLPPNGGREHSAYPGFYRHDFISSRSPGDGRVMTYSIGYLEPKAGRGEKELLYVVFASAEGEMEIPIEITSNSHDDRRVVLTLPDATEIELPQLGRQLYEISDGEYRESDDRVSLRQFVGFIRSDPVNYTIEALLSFARAHPDSD